MPVITTRDILRFKVKGVEFEIQFTKDANSNKTRYYINAPDEVRFERLKCDVKR